MPTDKGKFVVWLARALWGLVLMLSAASFALRLWNASSSGSPVTGAGGLSELLWWTVFIPALVPAYATVGAVVASRRPRNGVGWLCLAFGMLVAAEDLTWQYAARAVEVDTGSLPAGLPMAMAAQFLVAVMVVPLTLLLLLFPNGRFLSRRWRSLAWLAVSFACLEAFVGLFTPDVWVGLTAEVPNPIGVPGFDVLEGMVSNAGTAVGIFTLLAAVASVFLRWRGSGGAERQQLKWLVYVGAIIALALLCGVASAYLTGMSYPTVSILTVAVAGMTLGVPVAVGISILRHHLYDIDIIINRTLVYGSLTASLALVYLGSVVILQYAFRELTGGDSQLGIVASTLAIAALFNPLRRRIQTAVDRRFYRSKYDAQRTLASFSSRLRDETDLDALNDALVAVVRETVQPARVALWLRPQEDGTRKERT